MKKGILMKLKILTASFAAAAAASGCVFHHEVKSEHDRDSRDRMEFAAQADAPTAKAAHANLPGRHD